ncbi:MAG TPA: hypothetical protein VIV56_16880 [Gemmatimonadales bacterium]
MKARGRAAEVLRAMSDVAGALADNIDPRLCCELVDIAARNARRVLERHAALVDAARQAADILMCDRDNDDPCTEYAEGQHPQDADHEGDCNPCAVRRLLWRALGRIE